MTGAESGTGGTLEAVTWIDLYLDLSQSLPESNCHTALQKTKLSSPSPMNNNLIASTTVFIEDY